MFKVTFKWLQGNPQGGVRKWKEQFILFDADSAESLNGKIAGHIEEKSNCYHEHMKAVEITRI